MKKQVWIAIVMLVLAALACSAVTPGGSDMPSNEQPVNEAVPTQAGGNGGLGNNGNETSNGNDNVVPPSSGKPILKDDFKGRDSNWGTGTDSDSSVEYVNDALLFIVYTPNYFVYSQPNDTTYENIHLEATVANTSTDPNASFGIICHQQFIDDSFYYAYVTVSGDYGIVKAALARDDTDLVTGSSDLIPVNASSYNIGLDCGNGTLTLYVNGQQIDSATDTEFTSGSVALFAWSDEVASGTTVSFDDFIITELK